MWLKKKTLNEIEIYGYKDAHCPCSQSFHSGKQWTELLEKGNIFAHIKNIQNSVIRKRDSELHKQNEIKTWTKAPAQIKESNLQK